MKKFFKILLYILLIPYLFVAIFLTVCLLNYNDYNVTEISGKSFILIRDDKLEPTYKKNDLVIVNKNNLNELKENDDIFFYSKGDGEINVNIGKISEIKMITDSEATIIVEGDHPITSKFFIGKVETSNIYNDIGGILSVLESRWGYLFIIVFPILLLFIYEIYAFIMELKTPIESE